MLFICLHGYCKPRLLSTTDGNDGDLHGRNRFEEGRGARESRKKKEKKKRRRKTGKKKERKKRVSFEGELERSSRGSFCLVTYLRVNLVLSRGKAAHDDSLPRLARTAASSHSTGSIGALKSTRDRGEEFLL